MKVLKYCSLVLLLAACGEPPRQASEVEKPSRSSIQLAPDTGWRYTDSTPTSYKMTDSLVEVTFTDSLPATWIYTDSVYTAPPPPPPDTTPTDTVVTPPPPSPGRPPLCANEPAGFTLLAVQHFDAVPPLYPKRDAHGWQVTGPKTQAAIPAKLTVSGGVLTGVFPKGAPGGSGTFNLNVAFPKRSAVYGCVFAWLDPNFTDNGNAGTKFGFLQTPYSSSTAGGLNHYLNLTPKLGLNLQSYRAVLNRNMFGKPAPRGRFFVLEYLAEGTTARLWVDGVSILNVSNVNFFLPGQSPAFTGQTLNPTYGGGTNPVPYRMELKIDWWYLSGR
jgi:hypothetical protein